MSKIVNLIIIGLFLNWGCDNSKSDKTFEEESEILNFLNSKQYSYSISKTKIPLIVVDSISAPNHAKFEIGDSSNNKEISFSDVRAINANGEDQIKYKRKLHFVLINDTQCLISYSEGGIGTHDIIDYIHFKGSFKHIRYITTDILNDTTKLIKYLRSSPAPVLVK